MTSLRHAHWSKVIRFAKWIWNEVQCESESGFYNRIRPKLLRLLIKILPRGRCVCQAVQKCRSWSRRWWKAAARPSVDRKVRETRDHDQSGPESVRLASDSASVDYLQQSPHTHTLAHARGLVLQSDTLCTSGLVDDVMFSRNGPKGQE